MTGDKVVKETQDQIGQFLDVISIFLTAFAVIAIVVGAFIIFNTFSILVSQRVRESALLRALGASKKQVTRSVLIEAFLMARGRRHPRPAAGARPVARSWRACSASFGLDIAGDVLTLTPVHHRRRLRRGHPRHDGRGVRPGPPGCEGRPGRGHARRPRRCRRRGWRRRLVLGTIAMVVGTALAAVGLVGAPGTDAIWIGAGAVIWVITAAVLAPVLGHPVLVACRAVFGRLFGTTGRLAGENALRNPRRTGATASALMIGLAVVSAVGVLASSLSATNDAVVDDAVQERLPRADADLPGLPDQGSATGWRTWTASTWSRASRGRR